MQGRFPGLFQDFKYPERVEQLKPFLAMEILERAQELESQGKSIIHMELGEPGGETPEAIKKAVIKAINDNDTCYTHSLGKIELRDEIASYHRRLYGIEVSPDQIIVTSGSSAAMLLVFSALLDRGDRIIIPDPYYACYPNFIHYVGAQPLPVPVREEDGFKLRAPAVRKHLSSDVKAILINSPANPTGAVLGKEELRELAELGPFIVSDEVYHGINYGDRDRSILEYTDRAVVINGFSKRNIMTGWRLGYLVAPGALVRKMQKFQQNLFICACNFIQSAGIAALQETPEVLEKRFSAYNERRLYLYRALDNMGIAPASLPDGAFYMLANVRRYTNDSYSFALRILEEAGVAVTPGIDFGPGAEGYIRISYACSMENLKEGLRRLEDFLGKVDPLQA